MSSLQASPHKISHFAYKIPKTIALHYLLPHSPPFFTCPRAWYVSRERMIFVDINHGLLVLGISRDHRRPVGGVMRINRLRSLRFGRCPSESFVALRKSSPS